MWHSLIRLPLPNLLALTPCKRVRLDLLTLGSLRAWRRSKDSPRARCAASPLVYNYSREFRVYVWLQ